MTTSAKSLQPSPISGKAGFPELRSAFRDSCCSRAGYSAFARLSGDEILNLSGGLRGL
jgi:hypothetical protein